MLNIVIFGPPGVGKGTQSDELLKYFNLDHISTGDILREERKKGTELGLKAKEYHEKGNLVPSELVNELISLKVEERIEHVNGFIFDGYPRRVDQAETLDSLLIRNNSKIDVIINLYVEDDVLRQRLLERGKTSGRPDDQNIDIINNRIEAYKKETQPVLDYYNLAGVVYTIDGVQEIDKVFNDIVEVLSNKISNVDTTEIPKGMYCYTPIGRFQDEGEAYPHLKIKTCPYWDWKGDENGLAVCSFATTPKKINAVDQFMLDDQCKICAIKDDERD